MKIRSIGPILTSACLAAMLTSGVAPLHAASADPTAAQKALERVVSTVAANGWAGSKVEPEASLPSQVIASTQKSNPDPVMTPELLARLIKLARADGGVGTFSRSTCVIFKLCDGTKDMQVKLLESENPEGHFFLIPLDPASKDIVFVRKDADGTLNSFLTDKTLNLRAAAVSKEGVASLLLNEQALAGFKKAVSQMAKEAIDLPPTDTPVPAKD